MKKSLYPLLAAFSLAVTFCHADYDQIDFVNTQLPKDNNGVKPAFLEGGSGAFAIETHSDFISKANFTKNCLKHQGVSFCGFDVDASMIFYYNKTYNEAANIEVGYNRTNIHWKQNEYFRQNIFNTATVAIAAQTSRMCDWTWKGKLGLNMDTDHFEFDEYSTWDLFIWGRYTYATNWGLHMGIITLTGMKIDHVYPIFGFDWIINNKWKLNAVFPVNMSVVYVIDDYWYVELKGRAFETRNRVGKHENLSQALVQYFNKGIEFGINYDMGSWIESNIHAGYTFGGHVKIANKNNNNSHRFKFGSSAYVGAEVLVRY